MSMVVRRDVVCQQRPRSAGPPERGLVVGALAASGVGDGARGDGGAVVDGGETAAGEEGGGGGEGVVGLGGVVEAHAACNEALAEGNPDARDEHEGAQVLAGFDHDPLVGDLECNAQGAGCCWGTWP